MKIGVLVAMERELSLISDSLKKPDVVVRKCGIGKVNAALCTSRLIYDEQPDVIISTGCAAGIGKNVSVRDVVVSTELAYHDVYCGTSDGNVYGQVQGLPAKFKADKSLVEKMVSLGGDRHAHTGLLVSGDYFVDSKEKAQEIVSHFPDAIALDMESASIAQACFIYGVPFISFRIVSDLPLTDDKSATYDWFWGSVAQDSFKITSTFINAI